MSDSTKKDIGFSLEYMDKSTDPRDDFYRFAAGKWIDTHPLPPDLPSIGAFRELSELNLDYLHEIAERCASGKSDAGFYAKLVGDIYSSAMNTEKIEELKFRPIENAWKLVSSINSKEELSRSIPELNMLGVYPFFGFFVAPDDKKSSVYAFYINQGGLSLPDRDYYLKEDMAEIRRYYLEHMKRMFVLYGMDESKAKEWADTVLDIETKIAKASWASEDVINDLKNYNQIKTDELEKRYGNLMLVEHMKRIEVPDVDYIIVRQPDFLDFINSMMINESLDRIKIYLYWNVINEYASMLHKQADEEHFDMFGRKLLGQKEQRVRWKRAIRMVNACVGEALGSIYVKEHFDEESKRKTQELVSDLIEVLKERIKALTWMGDETKAKAVEKLSRMKVMVGHPDRFREYNGLVTHPDDYVGNVIRASVFETLRQTRRVGLPVDKEEWQMYPQEVNAYNSLSDNRVVFPAGILQPPFFDKNMDYAVNYGGIGTVIGHEITHGFDNNGRSHDADGNLNDWWTKEDEKKFNELADLVEKEYSAKEILPGVFINGKLTMGENLADLGGVNIAYDALMRRLSKDPSWNVVVDGFDQSQRFFISYAQVWRSVYSKELTTMYIVTDPHSPPKYRAIIPSQNNPAFDKAFPPKNGMQEERKHMGVW